MSENNLPHDIEAEEAALGALLLGGDINSITITAKDFFSPRNQLIFQTCKDLSDRGVSINQITVASELRDKLPDIGGAAYYSELIAMCPSSLDLPFYAEIIARLSLYRRMVEVSNKIAEIAHKAEANISDAINKADDLLLDLRKNSSPSVVINPERRIEILNERYSRLQETEGGVAIDTGMADLNRALGGGLYNGDLIILGARASMGKTTMLQNIANKIAETQNVLYVSCEMDVCALGDRDVAGLVGLPISTIRLGGYDSDLYCRITACLEDLRESKIYTYDEPPITTAKIMQSATAIKMRHGLGAIFVDYLGLLDDDTGENRNITLGYMTRKLKQTALKLGVPVVVAHQLSRAVESREDKKPMLSDLRESGHIEEDADVVLFLYRDSYYYDAQSWFEKYPTVEYPENITEIIIAKQRQGESNKMVRVYFDKEHQKFRDLARV